MANIEAAGWLTTLLIGGSESLSKQVNSCDSWGCYMGYKIYSLSPPDPPSICVRLRGAGAFDTWR